MTAVQLWQIYFWCCFAFVMWFCDIWIPKYGHGGRNTIGSLLVAFAFGWILWPVCAWRVWVGPINLKRLTGKQRG